MPCRLLSLLRLAGWVQEEGITPHLALLPAISPVRSIVAECIAALGEAGAREGVDGVAGWADGLVVGWVWKAVVRHPKLWSQGV